MQDIPLPGPETPSPFNRPDHCPRCDALATSWVFIGGRMFLCANCHAELEREGEPANLTPRDALRSWRRQAMGEQFVVWVMQGVADPPSQPRSTGAGPPGR